MKYAICNETFQDWPFDKAFAFAKQCGYSAIEFAPFTMGTDAYSISQDKRAEIRQQLADAELDSIGLHWLLAKTEGYYLTSPDPEVRKKTADYLCELTRLCRDLNGNTMVLGSPQQRNLLPGVDHAQAMEFAADVVRMAEPTMRELDVTLALEPLGPAEGDFLLTAASGMELAKMIDSPNVRLHLDVKAMSSEETPIPDIIRGSKDFIQHFHANDPNLLGPGMGEVNFEPIFAALKEIGYDGYVSVEVFDYQPGVEKIAIESIEYMQRIAE
ncbi:sugar phosphate isomerase/epimerase family protein [Planctomycetota bacterium]